MEGGGGIQEYWVNYRISNQLSYFFLQCTLVYIDGGYGKLYLLILPGRAIVSLLRK